MKNNKEPLKIKPELAMIIVGIISLFFIVGVYLPSSHWFVQYDTGGAQTPVESVTESVQPEQQVVVETNNVDPTEAALNKLGFSMSNTVKFSVK